MSVDVSNTVYSKLAVATKSQENSEPFSEKNRAFVVQQKSKM